MLKIAKPIAIPFPLSTSFDEHLAESSGRLINCRGEPLGDAGPAEAKWIRTAGLTAFANMNQNRFRGAILVGNLVFAAYENSIDTVDAGGTVTHVGTLSGTGPVTWARNNQSPTPAIQVVDRANGAFSVTTGSVTAFNGAGNLPTPNCVCGQDGYFFWGIGDNRIFAAGPNSTTVNSQTFTTVQSRSTGALLQLVPYQGVLFAFCTKFCEVYANTANAFPKFPYTRMKVIDRGLIGPNAIAGWEDGFGALHWVGDDCGVYNFDKGLDPQKVSPPDLDRLIQAADRNQLRASVYVEGAKSIWALSSPDWTWELNLNTQKWNERDSWRSDRFGRWRAVGSVAAFDKWLVGDDLSTRLLAIDPTNYREVDNIMRFRLESGPVSNFPNRTNVARADFNFVPGVGIAAGSTTNEQQPFVDISYCRDSVNWGNPLRRELGRQANGRQRVYVTNAGQSGPQGHRWRIDITDPVYVSFMGGTQASDPRAF